jgi:hypothetical protein
VSLEELLVQAHGVAFAPVRVHLRGDQAPGILLIVGGVPTHPEGLAVENDRAVAFAAALHRQLGGGVGVQHVVAVERAAGAAVGPVHFAEALSAVMLLHQRAQGHLVVLDDEHDG